MQDYIGFTYNGKHSIRDLKIYRTSNSGRYDENLTATMTDKTTDVPGGDGQYYFGTTFKNRTFTVAYAFDNLTERDIRLIKQTFSGDGIYELVFDERPYMVWSAKVTGTASMKHLCFEENGERIYKGEGSITFTCYYPFARTPKKLWAIKENGEYVLEERDGKFLNNYDPIIYTNLNEWHEAANLLQQEQEWVKVVSTSPYQVNGEKPVGIKVGFKPFFQTDANNYTAQALSLDKGKTIITGPFRISRGESLVWDTSSGLLTLGENASNKSPFVQLNPKVVPYSGNSIVKFKPGDAITP